jgi:monovalent cation:H+ antiporter-2, CPA2 family
VHGDNLLVQLVVVLGTAAVTTILFQVARLPVALGYVLAGLLIGPHVPVPLVADASLVTVLSELGVILLMFSIGLELRLGTLGRVGASAGLTAVIEVGAMVTIGYLVATALGWTSTEALFAGACVGISSTMLVAKAFEDTKIDAALSELVFAILVFEDLIAILLLAILTGVASGAGLSAGALATSIGTLAGFLAVCLVGGLIIVPRAIRMIARLGKPETLLISGLAVCFGMAALAHTADYSVALGAFLGGMLVAESGHGHELGTLVRPFRDVFAAIFFVSIGMTIDPSALVDQWFAIVVLSVVVLIGKPFGVTSGAFLAGNGLKPAIRAGLSMAQIGELSFVMAGIGIAGGVVRDTLLPVVVGVGCVTAMGTPTLVAKSGGIAARIARGLPRRIATFISFYDGWLSRLRARRAGTSLGRRIRGPLVVLLFDAAVVAFTVIGASLTARRVVRWAAERTGLSKDVVLALWIGLAVVIAAVFLFGVVRNAVRLANALAAEIIPGGPATDATRAASAADIDPRIALVLPPAASTIDLGRAPRRALIALFEVAITLAIGVPLAALTQPFVPGGAVVVLAALVVLIVVARRRIADLDGHLRAGSELIVELLGRQSAPLVAGGHGHGGGTGHTAPLPPPEPLAEMGAVMPGLGDLAAVTLPTGGAAVGSSLAQLDLRARTGATVLAIRRGDTGMPAPSPTEPLAAGDVLALAGSDAEILAAREVLLRPASPSPAQ